MIGPDEVGSLKFRYLELLGASPTEHVFSVAEALESVRGIPVAILQGEADREAFGPRIYPRANEPKRMLLVHDANHHYSGKEDQLGSSIREATWWICNSLGSGKATP